MTPDESQAAQGPPEESLGDSELARVLEAYLADLEAGRPVDTERLMADHPAIADRLRTCLGSLRLVDRAAQALSAPGYAQPPDRGEPERRLGDFRILREVGRGGMGVVYEAEQISLRRRVALKVLPFAAAIDPRQLQRFQLEAQAAATLHHPQIVPVHGVGCERGVHYYAMQFIDGRTLADVIRELRTLDGLSSGPPEGASPARFDTAAGLSGPRRSGRGAAADPAAGPLDLRRAAPLAAAAALEATGFSTGSSVRDRAYLSTVARLGMQAAEALEHAHQHGILHRDVKPSNLLIDARGNLWVTDFGLARFQSDNGLTMTGDLLGTLRYMSPEQALARRVVIDHRSDVYSLGVTLYEMLTLRPAFDGRDRAEILRRIAEEEAPALRKLNPAVPFDLETVVSKAMDKDVSARYATAGELAADLRRFLAHQPVKARRPSLLDRAAKWARRNTPAIAVSAVLAVAALAGLGIVALARDGMLRRHNAALLSSLAVVERKDWTNRRLLYGSQVRLAQQELAAGQVDFAQEALDRLLPGREERDLRSFEWYYLHRLAHRDVSLLFGHDSPVHDLALSPDGRILASGDKHGLIVFWDLVAWREYARSSPQPKSIRLLASSPDGRAVVSIYGGSNDQNTVKLWDAATGRETASIPGLWGCVQFLEFSHDGRTLVLFEGGLEPGSLERRLSFRAIAPDLGFAGGMQSLSCGSSFVACPDRRSCAVSTSSGQVQVYEMSAGALVRTLPRRFSRIDYLGVTPDGGSIFVAHPEGLSFFDLASGVEQGGVDRQSNRFWLTHAVNQSAQFTSRLGRELVVPGSWPDLRPRVLEGVACDAFDFLVSPDGRRTIALLGEPFSPVLWDAATGAKRAEYRSRVRGISSMAFTPGGDSLIFGSGDSRIRAWHIQPAPEPLGRLAGHDAEVWDLAYSHDGTTLASAADDHTIKLWDRRDGALLRTLTGHGSLVTSLAVSPDGKTLASGGFDRTVRLWDFPSGRPRAVMTGHTDRVRGVAFSPDGRQLASCASDGTVRLWDPAAGRPRETLQGHVDGLHDLAFDRTGTQLVSAGNDMTLRVWDIPTGRAPLTLPCPRSNTALAFSQDRSLLASGDDCGNVIVWDVETWTRRMNIKGSDAPVWGLSFSPDGRTLAAACGDARVRLWDPATGQLTLVLDGHLQRVNDVAFSPDGSTLASASHDGAILLWHAGPR